MDKQLLRDTDSLQLNQTIIQYLSEIDRFSGSWLSLGQIAPERLTTLRQIATLESIGSSNRIEGNRLTNNQIQTILDRLSMTSFKTRDEQEVAGYAKVMDTVFKNWEYIPFSENVIRQLHKDMLSYSDKDDRHRGNYKTVPNSIAAFKDGKQIGIIFETASPLETPLLMKELVDWTQAMLETRRIHPLVVTGIFTVFFLAIHPFTDGNGRLSRILTSFLLLKSGYTYIPYSSLESIIEANKAAYYAALRETQISFRTDKPDWTPWLEFFLSSLTQQVRQLQKKVNEAHMMDSPLPELSQRILELARSHGYVTTNTIHQATGANKSTIKYQLGQLQRKKLLQKYGNGPSTHYKLTIAIVPA